MQKITATYDALPGIETAYLLKRAVAGLIYRDLFASILAASEARIRQDFENRILAQVTDKLHGLPNHAEFTPRLAIILQHKVAELEPGVSAMLAEAKGTRTKQGERLPEVRRGLEYMGHRIIGAANERFARLHPPLESEPQRVQTMVG